MLGLLVGGALSLFGANKAKKDAQKATNDMNDYNNPANVRLRAEEAGFNPLLFVGPGVGQQTAPAASGQMGAAIADFGMMAAEKISGLAEEKARMQNLQLQNEKLQKELQQATLRPKSAGLYGPVATAGALTGPASKNVVSMKEPTAFDTSTHQGPEPLVNLFNPTANKWITVHPGIAKRLELVDGDTILAEDYEAILGDVGSELINTPNAANEFIGQGVALRGQPVLNFGTPAQHKARHDKEQKEHEAFMSTRKRNFDAVMFPRGGN